MPPVSVGLGLLSTGVIVAMTALGWWVQRSNKKKLPRQVLRVVTSVFAFGTLMGLIGGGLLAASALDDRSTQTSPSPLPQASVTFISRTPESIRYVTAGFQVDIPEAWRAFDLDKEGGDVVLSAVGEEKPELLPLIQLNLDAVLLLAFDPESDEGLTHLMVARNELAIPATIPGITDASAKLLSENGIAVVRLDDDLTIGGADAGRIEVAQALGPFTMHQVTYTVLPTPSLQFTLTFTTSSKNWEALNSTFKWIAESFRLLD